nr:FIST C-terminal domain-containing protein [Rhodohalobacter sp. 614A]
MYKLHLGDDANGLPGTALLYPVAVTFGDHRDAVVRTVHYVDELNKSIVLGGDVSEGSSMRFMRAEFDDLMKGVEEAAVQASEMIQSPIELAIVVSCIGRKLLFGQTIQKEIDLTKDHIGNQAVLVGFYSYGEICPVKKEFAQLNHQMLTITAISEILH